MSDGKRKKRKKPAKPFPDFPMWPHPSGRWCRKYRKEFFYFGTWDKWQDALKKFEREWPFISQGEKPPEQSQKSDDGASELHDVVNAFLVAKQNKADAGEITPRTFRDYYLVIERMVKYFGRDRVVKDLRPEDFEEYRSYLSRTMGPVTMKNEINRCRVIFKFALDNRLIDQPVFYGQGFNRPAAKVLRRAKHEAGPKLFTAAEIRKMIDKADYRFKAMILLAVNGGLGNTDIASLPISAVDGDWLTFPRPKTEIMRRIPLWKETVEALNVVIEKRPNPIDEADAGLCFLTDHGRRWVRSRTKQGDGERTSTPIDSIVPKFRKLREDCKIKTKLGFYSLRHVFLTVGEDTRDFVSVHSIMRHSDSSTASIYRERISDERLRAVVDHVHAWLFPKKPRTK